MCHTYLLGPPSRQGSRRCRAQAVPSLPPGVVDWTDLWTFWVKTKDAKHILYIYINCLVYISNWWWYQSNIYMYVFQSNNNVYNQIHCICHIIQQPCLLFCGSIHTSQRHAAENQSTCFHREAESKMCHQAFCKTIYNLDESLQSTA